MPQNEQPDGKRPFDPYDPDAPGYASRNRVTERTLANGLTKLVTYGEPAVPESAAL
jgi:hypothetical protein